MSLLILILCIFSYTLAIVQGKVGDDRDSADLRRHLMSVYDGNIHPVPFTNTVVRFVFKLESIVGFREETGQVELIGTTTISWEDPKLKWTPTDYGSINNTSLEKGAVWTPPVTVVNLGSQTHRASLNHPVLTVSHTGICSLHNERLNIRVFAELHGDSGKHFQVAFGFRGLAQNGLIHLKYYYPLSGKDRHKIPAVILPEKYQSVSTKWNIVQAYPTPNQFPNPNTQNVLLYEVNITPKESKKIWQLKLVRIISVTVPLFLIFTFPLGLADFGYGSGNMNFGSVSSLLRPRLLGVMLMVFCLGLVVLFTEIRPQNGTFLALMSLLWTGVGIENLVFYRLFESCLSLHRSIPHWLNLALQPALRLLCKRSSDSTYTESKSGSKCESTNYSTNTQTQSVSSGCQACQNAHHLLQQHVVDKPRSLRPVSTVSSNLSASAYVNNQPPYDSIAYDNEESGRRSWHGAPTEAFSDPAPLTIRSVRSFESSAVLHSQAQQQQQQQPQPQQQLIAQNAQQVNHPDHHVDHQQHQHDMSVTLTTPNLPHQLQQTINSTSTPLGSTRDLSRDLTRDLSMQSRDMEVRRVFTMGYGNAPPPGYNTYTNRIAPANDPPFHNGNECRGECRVTISGIRQSPVQPMMHNINKSMGPACLPNQTHGVVQLPQSLLQHSTGGAPTRHLSGHSAGYCSVYSMSPCCNGSTVSEGIDAHVPETISWRDALLIMDRFIGALAIVSGFLIAFFF